MSRLHVINGRTCGDCTACCDVVPVAALDKPQHTLCEHLTAELDGCSIYKDRPEECRHFACFWLTKSPPEIMTGARRPDRVGLVVYGIMVRGQKTIAVAETRRGALKEPGARSMLTELRATGYQIVVIERPSHRESLGGFA